MKADAPKLKKRLNYGETKKLEKHLRTVGKKSNGLFVYDEGHSDTIEAETLGPPYTFANVRYFRRANFGLQFRMNKPVEAQQDQPPAPPEPEKPGDYALMRVELEEAHKRIDRLEAFVKFLDPDWRAPS